MDYQSVPMNRQPDGRAESDTSDHYDSVMQWLDQQACGGTVKRKRKINKQQVTIDLIKDWK